MRKKIRFGIIGCGLMGREFGSAVARWCHLTEDVAVPEIVGVCDFSEAAMKWFTDNFDTVKYVTSDYQQLLAQEDIDAIYCALPHNLHGKVYSDIIRAKKHLLGEKPFGIDAAANAEIMQALAENPEVTVRCASEFPFFPACQELIRWIREKKFMRILVFPALSGQGAPISCCVKVQIILPHRRIFWRILAGWMKRRF